MQKIITMHNRPPVHAHRARCDGATIISHESRRLKFTPHCVTITLGNNYSRPKWSDQYYCGDDVRSKLGQWGSAVFKGLLTVLLSLFVGWRWWYLVFKIRMWPVWIDRDYTYLQMCRHRWWNAWTKKVYHWLSLTYDVMWSIRLNSKAIPPSWDHCRS